MCFAKLKHMQRILASVKFTWKHAARTKKTRARAPPDVLPCCLFVCLFERALVFDRMIRNVSN